MRRNQLVLLLFAATLATGFAACAGPSVSPNDPQYARSGAPRTGEPMISPENSYGRIMGPDGSGGGRK
jgi:hypothetical protein